MKKEDLTYSIGVIRKTLIEKRKVNSKDVKLIINRLQLISLDDIDVIALQNEIDSILQAKIYYFERKGNNLKIEEYKKIKKRNNVIFEFFLSHKSDFI